MGNTHIVIMAGGVGSRLWPASTPERPKQFLDILGVGKSLIRLTYERFLPLCSPERFWVVTSKSYVSLVKEQLPDIPLDNILAEPAARNTAPCIAYACSKISIRYPDANIVVTPADALVLDTDIFRDAIRKALGFTAEGGRIVTVGITPTRPETGYGYIHATETVPGEIAKVSEFREKPDLATAEEYLRDGHYLWNAGIFVWNAKTIEAELRRYAPSIMEVMDRIAPSLYTDNEPRVLEELFPTCEKISIDYAVMEKSALVYTVALNPGWSDLGSWGSVKTHIPADADGNCTVGGDIRLIDCKGCLVHAPEEKTVIVEGLRDCIITESGGRLLICHLSEEQHIREWSTGTL